MRLKTTTLELSDFKCELYDTDIGNIIITLYPKDKSINIEDIDWCDLCKQLCGELNNVLALDNDIDEAIKVLNSKKDSNSSDPYVRALDLSLVSLNKIKKIKSALSKENTSINTIKTIIGG